MRSSKWLLCTLALTLNALKALASDAGVDQEITAAGPKAELHGSAYGAFGVGNPVMLLIPGSGATDRNGNSFAFKPELLRRLAKNLSSSGVSTVRIDKRGMFGSATAVPNANAVTMKDYAEDILSWINAIRKFSGAKCVWLAGHSEGGLVALSAATIDPTNICGLVLLSTPGRPLANVLREQLQRNLSAASLLENALFVTGELEDGRTVPSAQIEPALLPLFHPAVQNFIIDQMKQKPLELIRGYDGPIIIVQGAQDRQVTIEDACLLADAKRSAQLIIIDDADHQFLPSYKNSDRPGDYDPASEIANRVTAIAKSRPGTRNATKACHSNKLELK